MDKVIKHNADTIKYKTPKQYGDFREIEHVHLTTNDVYSIDSVINLFKDIIPTVIREEYDEDDSRGFYFKKISIIYSKYGLDLSENIHTFMRNSSTLVINSDWESQFNEWVNSHMDDLRGFLPTDSNVIQSHNKLKNYIRIVDQQFPPIPMYDRTMESKLQVDHPAQGSDGQLSSLRPPKVVYDITYVSTSEIRGMVLDTDKILQYCFKDAPFTPKEASSRLKFFYTNLDVTVYIFFEISGRTFSLTTNGKLIDNGQTV